MRPAERLLRKGIPKDAIRKELERWSDRLSDWDQFFTAVLVAGLVIEYLPEVTYFLHLISGSVAAMVRPHAEQLREFGGLLVIIGVVGEFGVGRRGSRVETDLREEYNSAISAANGRIAETLERAARAERAAKEADLARVKMEGRLVRRTVSRHLTDEEIEALQEKLKPLSGQRFAITVAATDDTATNEPQAFAWQLSKALHGAGWIEERVPGTSRVGHGVIIECRGADMGSSMELARALGALGIGAKASWIENDALPFTRIHVGLL